MEKLNFLVSGEDTIDPLERERLLNRNEWLGPINYAAS
eukprot:Gb_05460 [translate_table: standard]